MPRSLAPSEGFRGRVVLSNVLANAASEIGTEVKRPRAKDLARSLKPELDLVQPRRIGRGEMQAKAGRPISKLRRALDLVRPEIIEDDVNLARVWGSRDDLTQERDKGALATSTWL